ncbi:Choline transporter-like protein [Corchorus olitorius]|uniref:Choline transporter-like protein n=1 Tax=Corchorus olitorius TaxID=93759 RepID=A0A1R3K166_9ROSI|nr:Choline transporter-like protein [Corchorus olitorius]
MVAAVGLVGFLIFKGIQGLLEASNPIKRKEERVLKFLLPQVEAASLMSITLAFVWQKALREWPQFMVHFILWCTFFMTLSAGILLICFQKPATDGIGVCFIAFAIVSRVIALYYLRGMQSNTQFCFQRALTRNLGSACLGSLFVPAIEALRIVARGLNLLEGEDEFMFSCAHCCLRVMESIFRYGNGWAYVQIAAYGKCFVRASQDTWALFEREEMVRIVDADMTSAICFLTGVCSGSICVIVVAAWTMKVYHPFTATISLLAFFIGYLMTRIAMALPHACVSCYYVCYAENPENRLFDKTIKDRINLINSGRDVVVPTPRVPHRFAR